MSEVLKDDEALQRALLDWFQGAHRALPWREGEGRPHPSPYAVLVSELMCQQTRVETVIPYFERWMRRWPSVEALAAAPLSEVLAQWSGLGYYRRARHLHATAQTIMSAHGGALPHDHDSLAALPGLGPYSVGAVRSIGFDLPAPAVDGNVARVLTRWDALELPPASTQGRKAIWDRAERLADGPLARQQPRQWTQALMELGATICTPRRPECGRCPVPSFCRAFATGQAELLPRPAARRPPKRVQAVCALLVRKDKDKDNAPEALLGRRPEVGRWAGMWEPPLVEGTQARTELERWLEEQGLSVRRELPPLVHTLTHRRYEVELLVIPVEAGRELQPPGYDATRWRALPTHAKRGEGLSRLAWRALGALSDAHEAI